MPKGKAFASVLLMALILTFCWSLPAQAEYKSQSQGMLNLSGEFGVSWDKDDVVHAIAESKSDNSTVLAGYTASLGAGDLDLWLIKTASHLNVFPGMGSYYMDSVEWRKTFGGTQDDVAEDIVVASDGGYVLAGYTKSFGVGGSDAYLVKTDVDGNLLWNVTFGGVGDDALTAIALASDGGYLLAGYTNSDVSFQSTWVIKTDSEGNMQWNATYSGQGAKAISPADDGGYVIAIDNPNAFGLTKIDTNGQTQWNQSYSGLRAEAHVESVTQTVDGGYALAGCLVTSGFNSSSPWLVKTDAEGNMLWEKDYGGILGVYSIVQTNEGGYAMCGDRACLIITDSEGDVLWSKTYDALSEDNLQFTRAYCILQPNSSQFLMAGTQQSYGQFLTGLDACMWRVTLKQVEDITPPQISILSPENKIYTNSSVPLFFSLNKPAIWMGYQIDSGLNITITGNTTIPDLPDGNHNITLYAADADYNSGRSQTVCFENFVVDTVPLFVTVNLLQNSVEPDALSVNLTANKPLASASYSLDGQTNQTLTHNSSLADLASGEHTLMVFAEDELGLVGTSGLIQFTVAPSATPSQASTANPTTTTTPTPDIAQPQSSQLTAAPPEPTHTLQASPSDSASSSGNSRSPEPFWLDVTVVAVGASLMVAGLFWRKRGRHIPSSKLIRFWRFLAF